MKTFLLLLALNFTTFSYSQDFLPMLEEDNRWSVDVRNLENGQIITTQYRIEGEEVINGVTYKKVIQDENTTICNVRENNGQVYYYDSSNDAERLLMDFNAEIGDVIELPDHCFPYGLSYYFTELEVIDTQTTTLIGEERKVLVLQPIESDGKDYTEFWIEGIGSTAGVGPGGLENIDFQKLLVCFTQNNTTVFFNNATSCDNTTLEVVDFKAENFVLTPNPVTNISTLKIPSETNVDQLKIYSIDGRLLYQFQLIGQPIYINKADYSSGIYFFQLLSENKILTTSRFIVQ